VSRRRESGVGRRESDRDPCENAASPSEAACASRSNAESRDPDSPFSTRDDHASPTPHSQLPTPDDEASRLALAFKAGDRNALAQLHQALRSLMVSALARYREHTGSERRRSLPNTLEHGDLAQQSWLILAELAERWQPSGGSFAAYFRVSYPWALTRYVRRHSPSRRAKGVLVLGAERPDIQEQLDIRTGADGREWDDDLAWSELLEHLAEPERAVLLLHLADEKTFTDVARALELTRPAAYRLYRRALKRVQGSPLRIGARTVFLDADTLHGSAADRSRLERQGDLLKLVRALHAGARGKGRVRRRMPGRDWLADRTGLSQQRVTRLLTLLVDAGCVRDRGPRRAGRLVYATARETLAALGVRTRDAPSAVRHDVNPGPP
jgi:RNA polymerase sigma factor (sigma-70 family)